MTHSDAVLPVEPAEALAEPLPAQPPPKKGPLALLGGLLVRPRATFAYLRDHGGSAWLWPLLLALLVVFASRLTAVPIERAQAQAALEALQEQLEGQLPPGGDGDNVVTFGSAVPVGGAPVFSTGPASAGNTALTNYGLPLLGVLGQWLLAALVLLGLTWVLGGRPRPGAILRMSAWALLVPVTARALVGIALMLATGSVPLPGLAGLPTGAGPVVTSVDGEPAPESEGGSGASVMMIGPGGSMGQLNPVRMFMDVLRGNFLSSLDIYTLWGLLLLTIGVAVTARLGWLKSAVATAGYFGLSLAGAALPPVLSFWMMSLSGAAGMLPMR